ncbi:MAG: APC family permease [Candidatus Saganbacteria bacterium]|nr:APC family permease [Candidatus Saganbacteria bacterium]
MGKHHYLGLIVALMTAATIFIISESYSQIIELFPQGGGGYIVASKLLSPVTGMISGCALLIDYMLTITLSIASGADAMFSLLPPSYYQYKIYFALAILLVLIVLNLRGVKESVLTLMPIFLLFVITHLIVIIVTITTHLPNFTSIAASTANDIAATRHEIGMFGLLVLLLRAFSMGAGTYTGIEAVSNGLPILREPKVKTAKNTMKYMMISLATVVLGLMLGYTLFNIQPAFGKTLNAVLFDRIAGSWGLPGYIFILLTLISEGAILFVAAQTGFIDGPRVLSNMAIDRWAPKRFALLSDRLVTMNGILIMGVASFILMAATNGSVVYLIVLYSINVFITFCLSQLGMVRYWWVARKRLRGWFKKLLVNGIGLSITAFILTTVIIVKFHDGGWITLVITGSVAILMFLIKKNYEQTDNQVKSLDRMVDEVEALNPVPGIPVVPESSREFDPRNKTAIILVKDFTGIGIKTVLSIFRSFGSTFKNVVFVQMGLIDASAFRGHDQVEKVERKVKMELDRYIELVRRHGYHTEGFALSGIDTVAELEKIAPKIIKKYPNATFFGGQVIYPNETFFTKFMHNYTLFTIQKHLYAEGIPLFILPIEV